MVLKVPLVIVSTSETIDDVFPEWLRLAYDGEKYEPYDLNMPLAIPKRPISHYRLDPPITQNGVCLAEITARTMKDSFFKPSIIYSAPDLASVQTATSIVNVFNSGDLLINVEPAISKWRGIEPINVIKKWFTVEEYFNLQYPVNPNYHPQKSVKTIGEFSHESLEDYKKRIKSFVSSACVQGKDCLIVADAGAFLVTSSIEDTTKTSDFMNKRKYLMPASMSLNHKLQKPILPFTRAVRQPGNIDALIYNKF